MWRKALWIGMLFALLAIPVTKIGATAVVGATSGETPPIQTQLSTYTPPQQEESGRDISRQDWADRVPLMIIVIIVVILINVILIRMVMSRNNEQEV